MTKINKSIKAILVILLAILTTNPIYAGNPQRAGQAGASELLINPWSRSSGLGGSNAAGIHGLEAIYLNVAGLAFTEKTELIFSQTSWLQYGSKMFSANDAVSNISSFGFAQKIGESGTVAMSVMSMDFGEIEITTTDLPDGGIGTYSPRFMNIAMSYAHIFSNSIYGGFTVKMISEQISNLGATGVALDAGIQYVTGKKDNLQFGISLKNIGPRMSFSGDGLSFRGIVGDDDDYKMTVEQRSAEFELPALLNMGISYDLNILRHRITGSGTFTSNSFQKDQIRIGGEYAYREMFMIRTGYVFEEGINSPDTRTTALRGPVAGFTIELPMTSGGTTFGLDYSYRHTDPFQGSHSIGARINL